MGLQRRTIQKLLRENFPGTAPLVVAAADREVLSAEITARLQRCDGVDIREPGWVPEADKPRLVGTFAILDPEPYYYYGARDSFRLLLDDAGRLTIKAVHSGDAALVSDLEEIVQFVYHCRQRLERQRALRAKRGKVRTLLAQAILAQVKKLAREERFDFMSESDAQKLKLYVRLSDEHALELHIPFREFKPLLPQLRSAIVALRQLYQSGLRFHIVSRRALPWRQAWVTYQSLGDAGAPASADVHAGRAADGHSH